MQFKAFTNRLGWKASFQSKMQKRFKGLRRRNFFEALSFNPGRVFVIRIQKFRQ